MEKFHDKLKIKIDEFVHLVYGASKGFPKEETYGVTSQMRRASLSVMLNYVEGFARIKPRVNINFLETSYGSLKETKYLLHFSLKENYLNETDYQKIIKLAEEIGAMLWKTIESLKEKQ